MRDVFVDTVGLLAVWNVADQWHSAADAAYRTLLAGEDRLLTTSLILMECGNAAARRPFRSRVNALRQSLMQDGLLLDAKPSELEMAWAAYDRGEAGQAGIIDQVSFVVMRRLGISVAFTNDKHYQAAGFQVLF